MYLSKKELKMKMSFLVLILTVGTMYAQKNNPKSYDSSLDQIHTGVWNAEMQGDQLNVEFKNNREGDLFVFSKQLSTASLEIKKGSSSTGYVLKSDAGILNLDANGQYAFTANTKMDALLKDYGMEKRPGGMFLMMGLSNLGFDTVDLLHNEGYPLYADGLVAIATTPTLDFATIKSSTAFLNTMKPEEPSLEKLLMSHVMNINKASVDAMKKYLNEEYSTNVYRLAELKSQNIDQTFLKVLDDAGFKNPSIQEIVSANLERLDATYISEIKKRGYNNISLSNLVRLKSLNVTGQWIDQQSQNKGRKLTIEELVSSKSSK